MALADLYRDMLLKLLPRGPIWNFEADADGYKFLSAFGDELSRVHQSGLDLMRERVPSKAIALIPEYERELGLPGECGEIAGSLADRRADIVARIVATGGQDEQYFIDTAGASGIELTIDLYDPVFVGHPVGVALTNGPWLYTWKVTTADGALTYFQAGISSSGDPLTEIAAQQNIECFLENIKPAHTFIVYVFDS